MPLIDKTTFFLGLNNPFVKKADPKDITVWLLDNVAYRPVHPYTHDPQPWQAEFVACYFYKGRKDTGKFVSSIADQIGLDGRIGADQEAKERIAQRVQPFIDAIAPARSVEIQIPCRTGETHTRTLGPSNSNGISAQTILTGGGVEADGTTILPRSTATFSPPVSARMTYAGLEGWAVISDVDDTIKITQTPSAVGILKTTFADVPKPTEGMPEFYKVLDEQFGRPPWFYLSASPYNLYPFLRSFVHEHYTPGTIILRDNSWMSLGGLLHSMTQGTQAYKTERMEKIHDWLPRRKFICIGDSTQTDPEAYAEIYKKYSGWVHAIYIRRVTDAPHMEQKNSHQRFQSTFQDVPEHIWRIFTTPDEVADHVRHLAGHAHSGLVGGLQGFFCKQEQSLKRDAKSPGLAPNRPLDKSNKRPLA